MPEDAYRAAPPPRPTCASCGGEFRTAPVYTPAGDLICNACEARRVVGEANQFIAAHPPPPDRAPPVAYAPAVYGPNPPASAFRKIGIGLLIVCGFVVVALGIFGLVLIWTFLRALFSGANVG
jgi:hypothetical protein